LQRGRRWRPVAGCLVALAAGGCALGPDFHTAAPPRLDRYEAGAAVGGVLAADGATQTLKPGQAVDPAWWRLFGSPALDGLVSAGLASSPNLASARAALQQSQAQARAGAGVFFPSLDGGFDAARERSTPRRLGQASIP
jgi:outer membrane protein TolC